MKAPLEFLRGSMLETAFTDDIQAQSFPSLLPGTSLASPPGKIFLITGEESLSPPEIFQAIVRYHLPCFCLLAQDPSVFHGNGEMKHVELHTLDAYHPLDHHRLSEIAFRLRAFMKENAPSIFWIEGLERWLVEVDIPLLKSFLEEVRDTAITTKAFGIVSFDEREVSEAFATWLRAWAEQSVQELYPEKVRQLEEMEEQFRLLLENASDIIFILDPQGRFLFINKKGEEVTGHNRSEWLSKDFSALVVPDDLPKARHAFDHGLEGHRDILEVRIRDAQGEVLHLAVNSTPIYQNGQVTGLMVIARDMTRSKRAEQELRRRNQELMALNRISRILTSSLDIDTVLRSCLTETLTILDLEAGDVQLWDPERQTFVGPLISVGFDEACPDLRCIAPLRERFCYEALRDYRVITSEDVKGKGFDPSLHCRIGRFSFFAVVPCKSLGKVAGVLHLVSTRPRVLNEEARDFLLSIGNQAAVAMENAKLYREQRRRAEEALALLEMSQVVAFSLGIEEVQKRILDIVEKLFQAKEVGLFLLNEASGQLELTQYRGSGENGPSSLPSQINEKMAEEVHRKGRPIFVRMLGYQSTSGSDGSSTVVGVPLVVKEKSIGVLGLCAPLSEGREVLGETDLGVLTTFANQAAIAIENARLYEAKNFHLRRLKALATATQNISSQVHLSKTLEAIVEESLPILQADRCGVFLLEDGGNTLRCALARGLSIDYIQSVQERWHELPGGRLLQHQELVVIPDVTQEPLLSALARREGYVSIALFPLVFRQRPIGAIAFYHDRQRHYSPEDLDVAQTFAHAVAIAIENARLFEDLKTKSEEVERKNKELEDFVYIASHDLQAPLVSIEGYVGRLLETHRGALNEEARRYLTRIQDNGEYMHALIRSLLDLSRLAHREGTREEVAVRALIEEVLESLEPQIRKKKVNVSIGKLPVVIADRLLLRQVFTNLLDNAIKYSSVRRRPAIEIGYQDGAFYVKDNGIGIPEDQCAEIFKALKRLHQVEAEGIGMGLYVVKRILEKHRGQIWVESKPGSGSTFFFTIG